MQKLTAPDVEKAVLGSILIPSKKKRKLAFEELDASDFSKYQPVFQAFKFIWEEDGNLDPSEIKSYLFRNNYERLSEEIFKLTEYPSHDLENSINTLKELSKARKISRISSEINRKTLNGEDIDTLLRDLNEATLQFNRDSWFKLVNPYNASVEPLEWIIEGFAAKGGITILGGEAGSGKSILVQYLLQKRGNQSILSAKDGKAVFLTGMDSSETEIRRRAKSIGMSNTLFTVAIPDDQVPFITNPKFCNELQRQLIEEEVDCIVFDTLADFHSGSLYDAEEANDTMKAFRRLARATGVSIILITHTRKSADVKSKYSVNDIADSRIFGTKSDFVFALKSEYQGSTNLIELQCLKSRSPKPLASKRIVIEFIESKGLVSISNTDRKFISEKKESEKELKIESRRRKAWELNKKGKSHREIADILGVTHPTIAKDLRIYQEKNGKN